MTRSKFGNVSPTIEAALERYQATADRQASGWFVAEIRRGLEHHEPRRGWIAEMIANPPPLAFPERVLLPITARAKR